MPSKKKKYNARFPAGRIKKIMQSDEEVGKVAQAVPVIISRTLELFVESLLTKTLRITNTRNAKTLSPSHMKQCIMSESRFDFLRELVKNIPDISVAEEEAEALCHTPDTAGIYGIDEPYDLSKPSTSYAIAVSSSSSSSSTSGTNILAADNPSKSKEKNGTINFSEQLSVAAETKAQLKRHWESVYASKQQQSYHMIQKYPPQEYGAPSCTTTPTIIPTNFYTEIEGRSVIQHTSNSIERNGVPIKLSRMDSAPSNLSMGENNLRDVNRRLQHQSKSIPCTSTLTSSSMTTTATTIQQKKQQQPTQPPPIVNIDLYNTPVIKIDYSNLKIPETITVTPSTISSAIPKSTVSDGARIKLKNNNNNNDNNSNSSSSSSSMKITTANNDIIEITPVINIDLSKLKTTPQTNNHLHTKISTDSSLELDEDYDNI